MRMKRRDIAAALMAVLMAGSIFAGCGSSNKNVNQDVNQNIESTQDTQLTTKAVADNETKAADAKNEKESESTTQEADTEVATVDDDSVDTGSDEVPESDNGSGMQDSGSQNDTSSEENEWNGADSEDYDQSAGAGQESGENNNQSENDASSSGGDVNISDDNSLLASAKVNTVTYSAYASEVLRLVNIERAKVGAAPLVLDEALCNAANMRAIEMDYSGNFSHTRPDGSNCFTVFDVCNVQWEKRCGENIAAGQATPEKVMETWINSSGHYANILNASYTKMGLGYSTGGGGEYGRYWAQEFAG